MDLSLAGKRALVCGSTQGIGRAAAVELALLGAEVTLLARDAERLRAAVQALGRSVGRTHDWIAADFTRPDEVRAAVEEQLAGGTVFHILVNNTGGPPAGEALHAGVQEYTAAFAQHLVCNHVLAQLVVPGMKAAGYGRIVNVISTSVKQPIRGLGVSNTIRGAVASWAKTLAAELGPFGITVNNVLPGAARTGRLTALIRGKAEKLGVTPEEVEQAMVAEIPAGRVSGAEEVAAAVAFLASPAAGYINGVNLPVDGGRTGSL